MPEGFLCPNCKQEFESIFDLTHHFPICQTSSSSNQESSPDATSNASPSFSASIQKPGSSDPPDRHTTKSPPPIVIRDYSKFATTGGIDVLQYKAQKIGQHDDTLLNQFFKKRRNENITRSVATENKLLLRLEKLLKVVQLPANKRRAYELTIVEWAKDSDVPLCPDCSRKFSILSFIFPHHCRLCGCVMCDNCILELSFENVVRILRACHVPTSMEIDCSDGKGGSKYDYGFKICRYCNGVIQNKYVSALTQESADQSIPKLHNDLKQCTEAFDIISKQYVSLCMQLHDGYLSADAIIPAQDKLAKLTKILARVSGIAEELMNLQVRRKVERRLAFGIRNCAIRYYENNRILPPPPTIKKYLQKQRSRMMAEKRRKLARQAQKNGNNTSSSGGGNLDIKLDSFTPRQNFDADSGSSAVDPVQQQIEYVRGLLAEAESQGRSNEIKLLEKNLESLMSFLESGSEVSQATATSSCAETDAITAQINYVQSMITARKQDLPREQENQDIFNEIQALERNLEELKMAKISLNSDPSTSGPGANSLPMSRSRSKSQTNIHSTSGTSASAKSQTISNTNSSYFFDGISISRQGSTVSSVASRTFSNFTRSFSRSQEVNKSAKSSNGSRAISPLAKSPLTREKTVTLNPEYKAKEGAVEESLDQNNNESGFGKDGNPFGDDFDSE